MHLRARKIAAVWNRVPDDTKCRWLYYKVLLLVKHVISSARSRAPTGLYEYTIIGDTHCAWWAVSMTPGLPATVIGGRKFAIVKGRFNWRLQMARRPAPESPFVFMG